jgi:hypothetical protein
LEKTTISWAVDDFSDKPADRMQAKAAERLNIDHQLTRLAAWRRASGTAGEQWRRAAFSSDSLAVASPEELAELQEAIARTVTTWRESINPEDGTDRLPVFVFTHGFPSQP